MGHYGKKYQNKGINKPECRLIYVPKFVYYTFPKKCFQKKYDIINVTDFDWVYHQKVEEPTQPKSRIFQGQDVQHGEAPWVVYVRFSKWVITARHCMELLQNKMPGIKMNIFAGGTDYERRQNKDIQIDKWFTNPLSVKENKTVTDSYDIALVKFESPFE